MHFCKVREPPAKRAKIAEHNISSTRTEHNLHRRSRIAPILRVIWYLCVVQIEFDAIRVGIRILEIGVEAKQHAHREMTSGRSKARACHMCM